LLKVVEDAGGAFVGDAIVGQSLGDLVETFEDSAEGAHGRELGAKDVGLADGGVDALAALVVAQVVIAEFLAEEGGGTARRAVGLGEIADAVWQAKPPMRLAMVRPAAKNRSGCREFGSEMGHASAQGRRPRS